MIWLQSGPRLQHGQFYLEQSKQLSLVCVEQAVWKIMLKLRVVLMTSLVAGVAGAAPAAIVGSDAEACRAGKPAVLVHLSGFKTSSGRVKLGVYPRDRFLQKKGTVSKDTIAVRSKGPIDVCLSVPGPGAYAVAIHHDANGNGDKDFNDGVAYSNNPRLSLTDLKPSFGKTAVQVGSSPRRVNVVMQYRKGLSVRPVNG